MDEQHLLSTFKRGMYLVVDVPGGDVEYEEWSADDGDEYPYRVQGNHVEGRSTSETRLY